jgi:methyl-accepting chemotaxis protein
MRLFFTNLKLSARFGLGFGITSFLILAITIVAVTGINSLHDKIRTVTDGALAGEISLAEFSEASTTFRVDQYRAAGATGQNATDFANSADGSGTAADLALESFSTKVTDPGERKLADDVATSWKKCEAAWKQIRPGVVAGKPTEAQALIEKNASPEFKDEFEPSLKKLNEWIKAYATQTSSVADTSATSLRTTLSVFGIAALACGALVGFVLARGIIGPLLDVSNGLRSMRDHCLNDLKDGLIGLQNGDLTLNAIPVTSPAKVHSGDEVGLITTTFNEMLSMAKASIEAYNSARLAVSDTIVTLSKNAISVAGTSKMLGEAFEQSRSASVDIANGSEQLALGATQAAATMDELLVRVGAVRASSQSQEAEIAQAAGELRAAEEGINQVAGSAQEMTAAAQEGNLAVSQTIASMNRVKDRVAVSAQKVQELDEKGKQIGHIVQSIESIAGQTNLLALNAAIEAARAGEHGRGFAVVADEVRKLAEQAANATQEIASLISAVTETVAHTVEAIEGASTEVIECTAKSALAGESLNHILLAAQQVAEQAEQVAAKTQQATDRISTVSQAAHANAQSTEQIAEGSNVVADAIANVAAVSEESAAGAQELSATIHQIGEAARELTSMSDGLHAIIAKFKTGEPTKAASGLRIAA